MQKQRNAVERLLLDAAEQSKQGLARTLSAFANENGLDRPKLIRLLAIANATVDDACGKLGRPMEKALDALIQTVELEVGQRHASKSGR